jgi:hypothetical protein
METMSATPFTVRHDNGVTWIDRNADAAFRKALIDIAPAALRGRMRRALAATPDPARDYARSQRYFGDRLPEIIARIQPLSQRLDRYMETVLGRPGFCEWLILTGYTNHYEMVKAFDEWAQMKKDS